jgi:hypothetical protein
MSEDKREVLWGLGLGTLLSVSALLLSLLLGHRH